MTISRLHETFIADTETSFSARLASVSGVGIAEPYRLQRGAQTLAYDLGLKRPRRVRLSQLPAALAMTWIFEDGVLDTRIPLPEEWSQWLETVQRNEDDDVYEFAEYLAYADVVPFEASPIELKSLASIATLSPAGIGTAMAFVVFGTSPLLLLAVPAGMIVCGAAAGVSKALEDGLRHRILGLLKPRTEQEIEIEEGLLDARRAGEAQMEAEKRLDETEATPDEETAPRSDVIGAKRDETADSQQQHQQRRQQYRTSSDS